jgi:hypothetical protein
MSDGETGATGPDGDDIGLPKTTVHKMVQGAILTSVFARAA